MTEDFNIEKRTYLKKIIGNHSSDNDTLHSRTKISLPRVKFLEPNGRPYVPEWAVEYFEAPKDQDGTVVEKPASTLPKRVYSRRGIIMGNIAVTIFEKEVNDLYKQGKSTEEICELLKSKKSNIIGAYNRYLKKTAA